MSPTILSIIWVLMLVRSVDTNSEEKTSNINEQIVILCIDIIASLGIRGKKVFKNKNKLSMRAKLLTKEKDKPTKS